MHLKVRGKVVAHHHLPAVLLDDGEGGFTIDFMVSHGDLTVFASGRELLTDLSGALGRPPPTRPGQSLWMVCAALLHPIVWDRLRKKPGHHWNKEKVQHQTAGIFMYAAQQGWTVAGRAMPLVAGETYKAIQIGDCALWDFDWIEDRAEPARGAEGTSYADIRVFTHDEWTAMAAAKPETKAGLPLAVEIAKAPAVARKGFSAGEERQLREAVFAYCEPLASFRHQDIERFARTQAPRVSGEAWKRIWSEVLRRFPGRSKQGRPPRK